MPSRFFLQKYTVFFFTVWTRGFLFYGMDMIDFYAVLWYYMFNYKEYYVRRKLVLI